MEFRHWIYKVLTSMNRFVMNVVRLHCLFLSISAGSLLAQSVSVPGNWSLQGNLARPYQSAVHQKIEALAVLSTAGYYDNMYGAKSRRVPDHGASLRIRADDCEESYLCRIAALPVSLLYFKGERLGPDQVVLTWETSFEANNAGFEVEKAFAAPGNFEKVGFVEGRSNSGKGEKYEFPDWNTDGDVTYYRLKQLDHDGTFEYSSIIAVAGFTEQLALIPTPNPGPQSSIFFQVKGNDNSREIAFVIVNINGVAVYRDNRLKLSDNKRISIAGLPKLASGLYIAKITSGNGQSTALFMITD